MGLSFQVFPIKLAKTAQARRRREAKAQPRSLQSKSPSKRRKDPKMILKQPQALPREQRGLNDFLAGVCVPLCMYACDFAVRKKVNEDESKILNSFLKEYHEILVLLPPALFPTTSKHGKHSFTRQPLGFNLQLHVLLLSSLLQSACSWWNSGSTGAVLASRCCLGSVLSRRRTKLMGPA